VNAGATRYPPPATLLNKRCCATHVTTIADSGRSTLSLYDSGVTEQAQDERRAANVRGGLLEQTGELFAAAGRNAVSIRFSLPLVFTLLLLVVVLVYSWTTYRELSRSASDAAIDRLRRTTEQLALSSEGGSRRMRAALQESAADPDLLAFLRDPSPLNREAALEKLQAVREARLATTQRARAEIRGPDERILLADGPPLPTAQAGDAPGIPLRVVRDSVDQGPVFSTGEEVYSSQLAPIRDGPMVRGHLVVWGRVGLTEEVRQQIQELAGTPATFYFAAAGRPQIVIDFFGKPVSFPGNLDDPQTVIEYERGSRGRHIAAKARIRGTPWTIIGELSDAAATARPRSLIRRLMIVALLLIALGTVGAILLSRWITGPIGQMTEASRAMARGDYSQRIRVARSDELGQLARTFNSMSAQVEQSQRGLEEARRTAEHASHVKSQFLATMSHEIRTPINAIIGYTELLDLGISGTLSEGQRAQLARIRSSGRHLVGLIDDVLDLAKVEAGRMPVASVTAIAGVAVETALSLVRPQAAAKAIQLATTCAGDRNALYLGDQARVQQILINLLSNAVKFTPSHGRVGVRCGSTASGPTDASDIEADGWTCLTVEDTGVGIPADKIEAIFQPFTQVESGYTRTHGGTGLGLTISRRLARLMGGDLTVESREGQGSRFILWLPAPPSRLGPIAVESHAGRAAAGTAGRR
jgi:signal transduction histidine kinase